MTNTIQTIKVEGLTKQEVVANIMTLTVPQIEEHLDIECVDYRKRLLKEAKAELLMKRLFEKYHNENKEVEDMTDVTKLNLIDNEKELDSLNKKLSTPSTTPEEVGIIPQSHSEVTDAFVNMMEKSNEAAEDYLKAVDKFNVIVEDITIYPPFREASPEQIQRKQVQRINKYPESGTERRVLGAVILRIPEGLLRIKSWDPDAKNSKGGKGKPVYLPFEAFNLDLVAGRYNIFTELDAGKGFLRLPIIENISKEGVSSGIRVNLPKERRELEDGRIIYDELFRTADITQSSKEEDGIVYRDHLNGQFNAQVSAYVQMVTNTFVERNAENHRVFEKYNCAHLVRFNVTAEDDVNDITEIGTRENVDLIAKTNILYPIPSDEQNQIGDAQPQNFCTLTKEWVDMEAVRTINESYGFRDRSTNADTRFSVDHNGNHRQPRADEIINGGRIMKRKDLITTAIENHCASCHMYCGNTFEFRETPQAGAQLIETGFIDDTDTQRWVARYPDEIVGEADIEVNGLRVRSGKLAVMGNLDLDFSKIGPVNKEERNEAKINISRAFAAMRYGIHRYYALTEEQHEMLVDMNAPENMTRAQLEKWNELVEQYNNKAMEVYEESVRQEQIPEFPQYFFAGDKRHNLGVLENPETAIEINVYDVMSELLKKHDDGFLGFGLGFEDMDAESIAKGLDDYADDLLFDVLVDGVEICITNSIESTVISNFNHNEFGGERTQEELQHAASGMQALLQATLTSKPEFFNDGRYHDASYLAAVKASDDPAEAIINMNVTEVVKGYLLMLIEK